MNENKQNGTREHYVDTINNAPLEDQPNNHKRSDNSLNLTKSASKIDSNHVSSRSIYSYNGGSHESPRRNSSVERQKCSFKSKTSAYIVPDLQASQESELQFILSSQVILDEEKAETLMKTIAKKYLKTDSGSKGSPQKEDIYMRKNYIRSKIEEMYHQVCDESDQDLEKDLKKKKKIFTLRSRKNPNTEILLQIL